MPAVEEGQRQADHVPEEACLHVEPEHAGEELQDKAAQDSGKGLEHFEQPEPGSDSGQQRQVAL